MRNLDPSQKDALQIILKSIFDVKEEPRVRGEEPEIEIEISKEDLPRSKRLEKAFSKVNNYGIK